MTAMNRIDELERRLKRPDCFNFAMSFLGDPEATELLAYIESLEALCRELAAQLAARDEQDRKDAALGRRIRATIVERHDGWTVPEQHFNGAPSLETLDDALAAQEAPDEQ